MRSESVTSIQGIHHERFDYPTRYRQGVPRRFSSWKDSSSELTVEAIVNVKRPGKASIVSSSSLERALVVTKRDRSVKIIGASTALFRLVDTMTSTSRN